MSIANIQGKLSRAEMKNIMAGSGGPGYCGDRGTFTNCPSGTTAQKCTSENVAYSAWFPDRLSKAPCFWRAFVFLSS